jgi:lipoprotein-releasing system ATP-binding protein
MELIKRLILPLFARDAAPANPAQAILSVSPTLPISPSSVLLRAQNLYRVLGTPDNYNTILRGVHLDVRAGEYVSIVGASGSGKSTLLYLLGGLDRPTQVDPETRRPFLPPSRVFIDGHDTSVLAETPLAQLRNEKCGFVFQFHYLLKEFTAAENIALPMFKLGKWSRRDCLDRAVGLLKRFGLADKAKRRTNRLSGGEQQRVAIARALANDPAVLLADEPTGNLDRKNSERVADLFAELNAGGQTIVMVTHDTALAQKARRMITMEDGRITGDSTTANASSAPQF